MNGSRYHGVSGSSLRATNPIQGNHSGPPFWNGTSEDQQNSQQVLAPRDVLAGNFDSFSPFILEQGDSTSLPGQDNSRSSFSSGTQGHWNTDLASSQLESQPMARFPSQDSIGAHSQRSIRSYDQRMFHNVSRMSIHMSSASSDTPRSNSPEDVALQTPTQLDLQNFNGIQYPVGEYPIAQPGFHGSPPATLSMISPPMSSTSGPANNNFVTAGAEPFTMFGASGPMIHQGPASRDSVMHNTNALNGTPSALWDENEYLESQRSSPILHEGWVIPGQMMTADAGSPLEYAPSLEGLSPRVARKPAGPRPSKVASDLSRRPRLPGTEDLDESFKLIGRSSLDMDNTAREHPLYHNAVPQADGLYHCPWENDAGSSCQHKPEKLKCNYDKFVDSHLKPYRCKVLACKDLPFSSTACLLRHEREAHAMHGHGEKPFHCTYEGCERAVPGNGFPRHWNLRDHMKRVHNDPGQPKSNASGSPPPSVPAKSKKRKASDVRETSAKKVATPPVVVYQPKELSLVERYQEKHALLMETVKQLQDPMHADNMTLLRNANDCIKVMVQTTQRMTATPSVNQPSG